MADLKSVPESYRERQVLVQYALICAQAQKGGAEELQAAVDTLEDLIEQSPENLQSEMRAQYEAFCRQYDALLYELGIQALEAQDYSAAVSHLRKVSDMPHIRELFIYAVACWRTRPDGTAVMLKDALNRLNTVSPDYDGPYAEEIAALRSDLPRQITAAEAREKAAREKARKADEKWIAALEATGLPYVGMAESEIHTTRQLGRAGYSGTDYEYQADAAGKARFFGWKNAMRMPGTETGCWFPWGRSVRKCSTPAMFPKRPAAACRMSMDGPKISMRRMAPIPIWMRPLMNGRRDKTAAA